MDTGLPPSINRGRLRRCWRRQGYEPIGSEHPADAAAAWRAELERLDVLVVNRASPSTDDLDLTRSCVRSRRETDPARHGIAVDVSFDALAAVGIRELLRRPLTNAELTDAPGTRSSVHYDRSAI